MRLEGFETVEAVDGDHAVELSRRERPAVILMDIMMPGRDGLSAVQEIRAEDDKVGIIVMTAYGTIENAVKARDAAFFIDLATKQHEAGATCIDVNAGTAPERSGHAQATHRGVTGYPQHLPCIGL